MIKKLIVLLTVFIFLTLLTTAYNVHLNNKDAEWPNSRQIDVALDNSILWLHQNRSFIGKNHNPALWWMLKESSDISDKTDLIEIYTHYKKAYLDKRPLNIWSPYFSPYYKPRPDILEMQGYRPYQIFFAYALSCDAELATEPVIQKQLKADFCDFHYVRPRCATHQQMSVRFLQKSSCGDQQQLDSLSSRLIDLIHSELTWDFRVGDAYLQRSLMLAESGRIDLIKPVWIQRILEAQNPDGGWDDIHPIIKLTHNKTLGLTSLLPTIRKPKSTFHATTQGIWLLSLLQQHDKTKVPTMGTDGIQGIHVNYGRTLD